MFGSEAVNKAKAKYEETGKNQEVARKVFLNDAEELYDARLSGATIVKRIELLVNSMKSTPASWDVTFSNIDEAYERLGVELKNFDPEQGKIDKEFILNVTGSTTASVCTGLGVGVLAPSAAMAIATTFGVASTGTAISTLSGAAASKAALAWLGGGALTAGGGGVVAGEALLAMAGPLGWTIAGTLLVVGGTFSVLKKREANEQLAATLTAETLEVEKRIIKFKLLSKEVKKLRKETEQLINGLEKDFSRVTVLLGSLRNFNKMPKETQELLCKLINSINALCELLKKVPGEA